MRRAKGLLKFQGAQGKVGNSHCGVENECIRELLLEVGHVGGHLNLVNSSESIELNCVTFPPAWNICLGVCSEKNNLVLTGLVLWPGGMTKRQGNGCL